MTINQIECFVETAKMGNISKAAESLYITQQTASNQIKSLERELGFPVFQRNNKGVTLTLEGEILFEGWAEVWEKYYTTVDKACDFHNKRSKQIRIGLEDMGKCSEDIMAAFSEYERRYPDLHICFEIIPPRQMLARFESGRLDMAILYESEFAEYPQFKKMPLHEKGLKVCIYMARTHPLADKKEISLWDIRNEQIGILNKEYSLDFRDQVRGFFAYNGIQTPLNYLEYSSRRDLEIGLMAGRCVAVVYEAMFSDENQNLNTQEIDVGNASTRISIFWKNDEMSTKARVLGDIIKGEIEMAL